MRRFHTVFSASCGAALLALSTVSRAQAPQGSEDEAMSQTARELFTQGSKAANQRSWDQCRAKLLAAWRIKTHAQIAGQLGHCEAELGLNRDAAEHLMYFLANTATTTSPERRRLAQELFSQARKKVVTLTVTTDVAGADVTLNSKAAGRRRSQRSSTRAA